jgi:predicted GNAT family acetyltransferase
VTDEPQVRRNDESSRYEILVGDEVAGFTEYAMHGRQIDLLHTEVDAKFEGHGLASQLIRAVLDDVREREFSAMPYCPFVRAYLGKHEDYLDLVPLEHRDKFGL